MTVNKCSIRGIHYYTYTGNNVFIAGDLVGICHGCYTTRKEIQRKWLRRANIRKYK